MSTTNETRIGYVGEVTLSYKLGDRIVKVKKYNKGWSGLYRFISKCLTDNMTSLNASRPQWIDIKCKHSGDADWTSCLFGSVPLTPSFKYEEDPEMADYGGLNYFSIFTATISWGTLDQSTLKLFTSDDACAVFLLSGDSYVANNGDSSIRMAQLDVDIDALKSIQAGTQIIVEWTMKFYNA